MKRVTIEPQIGAKKANSYGHIIFIMINTGEIYFTSCFEYCIERRLKIRSPSLDPSFGFEYYIFAAFESGYSYMSNSVGNFYDRVRTAYFFTDRYLSRKVETATGDATLELVAWGTPHNQEYPSLSLTLGPDRVHLLPVGGRERRLFTFPVRVGEPVIDGAGSAYSPHEVAEFWPTAQP